MSERTQWANFATGRMDWRPEPPTTDAEASQYIPQDAATQAQYLALRDQGATPVQAIRTIITEALATWRPPKPCPLCYPAPVCTCWRSATSRESAAQLVGAPL